MPAEPSIPAGRCPDGGSAANRRRVAIGRVYVLHVAVEPVGGCFVGSLVSGAQALSSRKYLDGPAPVAAAGRDYAPSPDRKFALAPRRLRSVNRRGSSPRTAARCSTNGKPESQRRRRHVSRDTHRKIATRSRLRCEKTFQLASKLLFRRTSGLRRHCLLSSPTCHLLRQHS